MKKKILVTGGFGFVGGHLLEILLEREPDAEIHVIDNLSSNPIPHELLLEYIKDRSRIKFDLVSIKDYLKSGKPTDWSEIYHLASFVGPAGVLQHAGDMIGSVVEDTYLMMDVCRERGIRLLDVSTSEIYGGGQEGYCSEEFPKIISPKTSPRLEYAIAKLACETAIINRCTVKKLDAAIVRPFNISGPRQSGVGGFVLPRFVGLALKGLPLTVFGDGKQIRAFTHVRDICDGIYLTMKKSKSGDAFNVGNPHNRVTIDQLADLVLDVTKSNAGKVYVDPKTVYGPLYEEANDKFPNADRVMKELGWDPKYSARDVVQQTYDYMRALPLDMLAHLTGKV